VAEESESEITMWTSPGVASCAEIQHHITRNTTPLAKPRSRACVRVAASRVERRTLRQRRHQRSDLRWDCRGRLPPVSEARRRRRPGLRWLARSWTRTEVAPLEL